jgi:hypothetical protein
MAEPWQGERLISLPAGQDAAVWVTKAPDGQIWFGVRTSGGEACAYLGVSGISELRINRRRSVVVGRREQDSLVEVREKARRLLPVSLGPGVWAAVVPANSSLTVSVHDGDKLLRSDAWETMARPFRFPVRLRGKARAPVIWRQQRS